MSFLSSYKNGNAELMILRHNPRFCFSLIGVLPVAQTSKYISAFLWMSVSYCHFF